MLFAAALRYRLQFGTAFPEIENLPIDGGKLWSFGVRRRGQRRCCASRAGPEDGTQDAAAIG